MSYGVIGWKSGQVQVEQVEAFTAGYDAARERFRPKAVAPWRSGRVTLTQRTVTFVPTGSTGARPITLDLSEITAVEASEGRFARIVSFRTATRVVHLRAAGGFAFAKQVAIAREARLAEAASPRSAARAS